MFGPKHLLQYCFRLDHFRALEAFWAIPGKDKTAENGFWLPSPGREILRLIKNDCSGLLPLVAEDLGFITSKVEKLRDDYELAGMKILQFAFDGNLDNPYLPENIKDENIETSQDNDGAGYCPPFDCDDNNALVFQDCDETAGPIDADGDGLISDIDCDDTDSTITNTNENDKDFDLFISEK